MAEIGANNSFKDVMDVFTSNVVSFLNEASTLLERMIVAGLSSFTSSVALPDVRLEELKRCRQAAAGRGSVWPDQPYEDLQHMIFGISGNTA